MEALKNLILAMNDRVNAQEENHKDIEHHNTNDLLLVKKELSKLETKVDSVESNLIKGSKVLLRSRRKLENYSKKC